ncbi:hypothetical protein SAMN05216548_102314 [Faunimonas pinastri]|uniref:Uncharacterized protein n=1 Tax=Faunimonas pinastri TaxID=1855383 RepID=A0A1H9D0W4_9HYPH|nr:hypothetical protein SAMN05216548_102314 [Faunimonas pinastri]
MVNRGSSSPIEPNRSRTSLYWIAVILIVIAAVFAFYFSSTRPEGSSGGQAQIGGSGTTTGNRETAPENAPSNTTGGAGNGAASP